MRRARDQALQFHIVERANGGDFLILRANTEDHYAQKVNEEIRALCPLNSAATIVFSEREDSDDPKLLERLRPGGKRLFRCRRRPIELCPLLAGHPGHARP